MKSVECEKIIFTNNNKYISINIFGEFTIFFPKNKTKKFIHNNKKMLQMRNNLTGVKTVSMTIKKFNGKTPKYYRTNFVSARNKTNKQFPKTLNESFNNRYFRRAGKARL